LFFRFISDRIYKEEYIKYITYIYNMSIDTSVGISNTSGYSFIGGDPTSTGGIVGIGDGISAYTPMTGGGKSRSKSKLRRKMGKRLRRISHTKVRNMKRWYKKKKKTKRLKKKTKTKSARQDIIKSIEEGNSISNDSYKKLTPSMKKFLAGISTKSSSGSTLRFSDFRSDPVKKRSKSKGKRKGETRGGSHCKKGKSKGKCKCKGKCQC